MANKDKKEKKEEKEKQKEEEDKKGPLTLVELKKKLATEGYYIKTASEITEDARITTGIFALDWILGGGLVQCEGGHRIEFWGGESTGKTTFCLHIVKKFQSLGKKCVFIDGEKSFDKTWAQVLGVDTDNLLIAEPNTLEELGNMITALIKHTDLIIIDSITSFIPDVEVDRPLEEQTMGVQAKINAEITRKIYAAYKDKKTVIIFINQMREKIGGPPNSNHQTSGGGRAIRHLYNTRVEFRAGKPIDVDGERIGHEINLKGIKNKRGPANRIAQLDVYNDSTMDNKKSVFSAALKFVVITNKGNTYQYKDYSKVGKDNFLADFSRWDELEKDVWTAIDQSTR